MAYDIVHGTSADFQFLADWLRGFVCDLKKYTELPTEEGAARLTRELAALIAFADEANAPADPPGDGVD